MSTKFEKARRREKVITLVVVFCKWMYAFGLVLGALLVIIFWFAVFFIMYHFVVKWW